MRAFYIYVSYPPTRKNLYRVNAHTPIYAEDVASLWPWYTPVYGANLHALTKR